MKRRDFLLKTSAAGVVMGATPFLNLSCSAGPHKLDEIGIIIGTVGRALQEDFEGVFERIAAAGYTQIEFTGYNDRTPEEIRALLDRLGLTTP